MTSELCRDATPGQWLIDQHLPWHRLAGRGPIGFEKYARVNFIPDPSFTGQSTTGVEFDQDRISELAQVGVALDVLTPFTTAPDDCYFAVWDGWSSITISSPPNFTIPNREYWLMRGKLSDYEHWNSSDSARWPFGDCPDPAFIWPADHAWCITNDVDPHFATVAAVAGAVELVLADHRILTVPDDPDVEPPYWD